MLQAEFKLLECAQKHASYDRYLLISDDALPILPPTVMNAILERNTDLISAMPQALSSDAAINYKKFFFYDHPSLMMRAEGSRRPEIDEELEAAVKEISELRKIGKKAVTICYGSQFWALTNDSIELLQEIIRSDRHLVQSFKYSALPDETMVQTIIVSGKHVKGIFSAPVYADFHSQRGGPRVLSSIVGLPFDLEATSMFVRKVAPAAEALMNCVPNRLLNGLTAWGYRPEDTYRGKPIIDEAGKEHSVFTFRLGAPSDQEGTSEWHGVEYYLQRPFRWTAAPEVIWRLPCELPTGTTRFFLPLALGRYEFVGKIAIRFAGQIKEVLITRQSLIAEFRHGDVPFGAEVALLTPAPIIPPGGTDSRAIGLGICL